MSENDPANQPGFGLRMAMMQLWWETELAIRHRGALARLGDTSGQTGLRLHLGCGPIVKPGWINIDVTSNQADFQLDLRERWPFADGSASIVYAEHFFEHLEHPAETQHFLAEAMRVLAPGATLSLGVPDTAWPVLAYADPGNDYWKLARERWHPPTCRTRMEHLNFHFRQVRDHKYAWDTETLVRVIAEAGFTAVTPRDFDPATDSETRRVGTIYADAVRPG